MIKSLKIALLTFFVVFGTTNEYSYGQKVNKKDETGKKQGKWVYFGKDRPNAGYPEKGKVEEGEYKNDRKEGFWVKYHYDGKTPKLKGEYIFNRPKGDFIKYHENGKVKEIGTFERDQYKDTLRRYHSNGQLEYIANYNSTGKEDGKVTYYYSNGQIEFEYSARNGEPVGKAVRYYENGDIKELLEFKSDGSLGKSEVKEMVSPPIKLKDIQPKETTTRVIAPKIKDGKFNPNGYNKVYNSNEELYQDGEFKDGRLFNGKMYVYDEDGILLKVKVYKDGAYHSDGQL